MGTLNQIIFKHDFLNLFMAKKRSGKKIPSKNHITIAIIVVIALVIMFLIYQNYNAPSEPNKNIDEFAQCLTQKGVKMYGTDWCPHCQNMKELFGSSFQYIDYINCDKNKDTCISEGIRGYPTWKTSDGSAYPGEKTFEQLGEISKCSLSK